ncbi:type II toxin-antitoxin system VapC family toxin [Pseudanabaena sp. 'Roaring Creek']|uniref:type II toxin-antitoxin system VapC family toxin n=1 Tax=Pseudanabaena sp. 'Roaring Creek' TaxID=1681830 RepID=UPI0006D7D3C6
MGMSYLIDTHILLWWIFDDPKLDTNCRDIIRNPDNTIIVSSVSAWEIATKYRIGKLPEAKQIVEQYSDILRQAKFVEMAIATNHALRAGSLPIDHRDPFDRMIIAQAEIENLPVISYDAAFCTGLIRVIPS